MDNLLPHSGQVGAEFHQYLGGHAFALADEAEQEEFGANVFMAHLQAFAQG